MARTHPLVQRAERVGGGNDVPDLAMFEALYLRHYRPHAKQLLLDASTARYRAVTAGRRGGKTYWGGRAFARSIFRDFDAWRAAGNTWTPPSRITKDTKPALLYWCVAPTYALGIYQRQEFFESIGGIDSPLVLQYSPSHNEVWLVGGILVQFKSADRPLGLVGSGLHGMWIDEAARLKEDAWSENLQPTLADKNGWAIFTSTPLGKNWYYRDIWRLCEDPSDHEWFGQHFTTADNTTLPHLALEMEKARQKLPPGVFRRNYLADFHSFDGQVFADFMDDATHIVQVVPKRLLVSRWGGMDWGDRNPGALMCLGADARGRVYVWAEDYGSGISVPPPPHNPHADSWARRVAQRSLDRVWADPAMPGHIKTLQMHGLPVMAADNSVAPGIDLINTLLRPTQAPGIEAATPALFIHRSCEHLRAELLTYCYGDDDRPVKKDDHAVDALRYGLYSEFRKGSFLARRKAQLAEEFPALFNLDAAA